MPKQDIKKNLMRYNTICAEIHQLNQDILNLSEVAAAHRDISAIVYTDMPKSNRISDPTYEKAQRVIDEYEKQVVRIEKRIVTLFEIKNAVEVFLETLSDIERQLITLRFFKKYKWEMIAQTVHYSRRQCMNIIDSCLL